MTYLGNGLAAVNNYEDALTVGEAELAMEQRLGAPEASILIGMGNLAQTYNMLGREEDSLRMMRDIYFGSLKLYGENGDTLLAANNYAMALTSLRRCKEAKELLRKTSPVARRVPRPVLRALLAPFGQRAAPVGGLRPQLRVRRRGAPRALARVLSSEGCARGQGAPGPGRHRRAGGLLC